MNKLHSDALFSPCRRYRYRLRRIWDRKLEPLVAIGLNPSTATAFQDDPTIRRLIQFARDWRCGGLVMLNIFAFRATDPRVMKAEPDPVGPENDFHIVSETIGRRTLCAWGNHGKHLKRSKAVRALIHHQNLVCLGMTGQGEPKHPLYIKGDTQPCPM